MTKFNHIGCITGKVVWGDRFSLSGMRLVWFIFIFFIFSTKSNAITDTTKISKEKYELNDPRNPDCPCHKLQKQAEDEYARLNGTKALSEVSENRRKKKTNWIHFSKRNFLNRSRGIKKIVPNYSRCFRW